MNSTFILGALLGLAIGLVYCYWKAIRAAYDNRGLISSGSNLVDAGKDFANQLGLKI